MLWACCFLCSACNFLRLLGYVNRCFRDCRLIGLLRSVLCELLGIEDYMFTLTNVR